MVFRIPTLQYSSTPTFLRHFGRGWFKSAKVQAVRNVYGLTHDNGVLSVSRLKLFEFDRFNDAAISV